jgi:hypothetical protein
MAEAEVEVNSEYHGDRFKENWSIVQKNGKRSKVVYSDEKDPSYLVGVQYVNEEQLSRVPILKKPF